MTKQERKALLLAIDRLKVMSAPKGSYGDKPLTVGQASYIDHHVVHLLEIINTATRDRTDVAKHQLAAAAKEYVDLIRYRRNEAALAAAKESKCSHPKSSPT